MYLSLLPPLSGASSSQGPLPQGRLQAKVVAADSIRASDTLKEVVVYKIRAADVRGEWTVSRRYSNFEQLHRQLRDVSNLHSCKYLGLPHSTLQLCTCLSYLSFAQSYHAWGFLCTQLSMHICAEMA